MKSKSLFKILSLVFSLFFLTFLASGDALGGKTCDTCHTYMGRVDRIGACTNIIKQKVGSSCYIYERYCTRYTTNCSVCEKYEYLLPGVSDCGTPTVSHWGVQDFCGTCGTQEPIVISPVCNLNCYDLQGKYRCKKDQVCVYDKVKKYNVCRSKQCSEKDNCICDIHILSVPTNQPKPTTLPVLINKIESTVKKYFFK